jgi:hypothetical protein
MLGGVLERLPVLEGRAIRVRFRPALSAWQGKLLSGRDKGHEIHAGSHMRRRWMVLDTALALEPTELERIFVHEVYHFAWVRAGNPLRWSYEDMAAAQLRAPGELGWSAEGTKALLSQRDSEARNRRWREYVCESFCDTAAWFYSTRRSHPEWTLPPRLLKARERWCEEHFTRRLSV